MMMYINMWQATCIKWNLLRSKKEELFRMTLNHCVLNICILNLLMRWRVAYVTWAQTKENKQQKIFHMIFSLATKGWLHVSNRLKLALNLWREKNMFMNSKMESQNIKSSLIDINIYGIDMPLTKARLMHLFFFRLCFLQKVICF